jgi:hypothetical protein
MSEELLVKLQASPGALTSFVHDGLLAYKIFNYNFKNFVLKNFGLGSGYGLDPDSTKAWIRIQRIWI